MAVGAQQGSTPVPDPTTLTTEQLRRELASLRETLEARMSGADRVVNMLKEGLDERQEYIDAAVHHLRELHEEKFRGIDKQFFERDTRGQKSEVESKAALAAALQAAKELSVEQNKSSAESIAKSEAATNKQIEQMGVQMASDKNAANDKIDDLKQRLTIVESRKAGGDATKDDNRANIALIVAVLTAAVAVIAFMYSTTHVNSTTGSINPATPQVIVVPAPKPGTPP